MMTHAAKLARDDAITEALRAANDALGDEEPDAQAFKIFAALRALRDPKPIRAPAGGIDYLARVQKAAQALWAAGVAQSGNPDAEATAGLDTPLGRLTCTTRKRRWTGKRGTRSAWASEYALNGDPITLREIRDAGLAQKATTRNRQKKGNAQ